MVISAMALLIDRTALVKYPKFRWIFAGQFLSRFGSMMTYVAVPFEIYQMSKSTFVTGMVGIVMLIPSVVGGLFGGSIADAYDRKKLIISFELAMAVTLGALALTSYLSMHSVGVTLVMAFVLSVFNGFHRPALEALTPRLVQREDMNSLAALNSLKSNVAMIGGPACAGILLSSYSVGFVYTLDALSFLFSIFCVLRAGELPRTDSRSKFSFASIKEGLSYARSRQELIGTYAIDILAMAFSMPHLLFPAVAENFGHKEGVGWLHSSLSVGALVGTLMSGWTKNRVRHGVLITLAAGAWSLSMIAFGFSSSIWWAMLFIFLAGYFDMISVIFRFRIWSETIPDSIRGRMAGLEMISYMSGPLIGNAQLGLMAENFGILPAISISSTIGLFSIFVMARLLPLFWTYDSSKFSTEHR